MRVFLRRHGWWRPWSVNCIDIVVTEKRGVAYNRREEIRAFQAVCDLIKATVYAGMRLHTVCRHNSPLFCLLLGFFFSRTDKQSSCIVCHKVTFCCYVLELRGVCGVCGVCGEPGSGLRGLDRLSWDETPWNRESVSRRSPSCKLLGLCCFSGGVWMQVESKDIHVKEKKSYSQITAIKQKCIIRMKYKAS